MVPNKAVRNVYYIVFQREEDEILEEDERIAKQFRLSNASRDHSAIIPFLRTNY